MVRSAQPEDAFHKPCSPAALDVKTTCQGRLRVTLRPTATPSPKKAAAKVGDAHELGSCDSSLLP